MGRNTFSAGYDFCETVKRAHFGLLVGKTAHQRSPFCGNIIFDRLPVTGIPFCCPTTFSKIEPSITNKDGFLEPDIPYKASKPLDLADYKKIIELGNQLK